MEAREGASDTVPGRKEVQGLATPHRVLGVHVSPSGKSEGPRASGPSMARSGVCCRETPEGEEPGA